MKHLLQFENLKIQKLQKSNSLMMSQLQDISNSLNINQHQNTQQSISEMAGSNNPNNEMGNYSGPVERCLRNFVLGKKIGAGTFSKVCIAKHRLTNQQVAIKIIEKSKIENEADRVRLDREMKIMRKVRHPNIAQLYQIIQTNKYIYLVMEYAARGELFEHIVSHQKLNQFQASKFLLQLVDAVEYLHQMGISHRDLKPENMLLDHKYNIKVTDFGLSNIYPAGKLLTTACGSPSYACPEMLAGKPYDGLKADIWSIGVVLYAMCFGYLPFDNPNISELYKMIKEGEYEIPEFASENLVSLLQRILEVVPSQRATIAEIRAHGFCKFSIPSGNLMKSIPGIIVGLSDIPYQNHIEEQMKNQLNIETKHLREQIKKNKHNENTCTYYLLLQRWLRGRSQSLSNYYANNYNIINRYALIEKVKANYDKSQRNRVEIRKFHVVQEEIKEKEKNREQKKGNEKGQSSKKIVHSIHNKQGNSRGNNGDEGYTEDDQNYLKSHLKHFAPNNTKLLKPNSKNKRKTQKRGKSKGTQHNKSKSPSPAQNKSKSRSHSNSKSKGKSKNFIKGATEQKKKNPAKHNKRQFQRSNILQVPKQFVYSHKKSQNSATAKSSSKKKQQQLSLTKKKFIKTIVKQQKQVKKRNNSLPKGIKLKF